jgi:hypothetical protein
MLENFKAILPRRGNAHPLITCMRFNIQGALPHMTPLYEYHICTLTTKTINNATTQIHVVWPIFQTQHLPKWPKWPTLGHEGKQFLQCGSKTSF